MIEASISSTDPTKKSMDRHQPPKNAKASWGKKFHFFFFGGGKAGNSGFLLFLFEMNCSPLKAIGISLDVSRCKCQCCEV